MFFKCFVMAGCLCHEKIKYRIPPITNIFDPLLPHQPGKDHRARQQRPDLQVRIAAGHLNKSSF
jgi:hypothetical protein